MKTYVTALQQMKDLKDEHERGLMSNNIRYDYVTRESIERIKESIIDIQERIYPGEA